MNAPRNRQLARIGKFTAFAAAILLTGCATTKQEPYKIPVAVGCLGQVPARPVPMLGAGDYPGDKAAAQAALLDADAWQRYSLTLEIAMSGCDPKPKE
ncbi:MAG: hypothetical protein ACXW2U_05535 [Telluria sp.]